jgi:hypothetical protein
MDHVSGHSPDYDLSVVEAEILSSANEDDYGLYEILWDLNSRFASYSEERKHQLGRWPR